MTAKYAKNAEKEVGRSRAEHAKAAKVRIKFSNLAIFACMARGISETENFQVRE